MDGMTDQRDSSYLQDEKAIVIQSFLRGALCRERVNRIVQKLIDDILLKRENDTGRSKKVDLHVEKGNDVTRKRDDKANDSDKEISTSTRRIEDDDSSIDAINDGQQKRIEEKEIDTDSVKEDGHNSMDDSASSIDILDIPLQKHIKGSLVEASISNCNSNEVGEEMQESVSDILSKFESNRDPNLKPSRNWSSFKKGDKPINHKPLLSPPIETSGLLLEKPKKSFVKDARFENSLPSRISSSEKVVQEHEIRTNMEIQQLLKDIKRIGESGKPYVTFGALFDDDEVANYYEALVGTLKASKKKGLIKYEGQFLLKGVNDKVVIKIL